MILSTKVNKRYVFYAVSGAILGATALALNTRTAHADMELDCSADTACDAGTVVSTFFAPVAKEMSTYLPIGIALVLAGTCFFWIVSKVMKLSKGKR